MATLVVAAVAPGSPAVTVYSEAEAEACTTLSHADLIADAATVQVGGGGKGEGRGGEGRGGEGGEGGGRRGGG